MSLLDRLKKQTQGKPIRAAIYARFSSDNQRDESIDAQVHAIKEFAKSNDIVIVEQSLPDPADGRYPCQITFLS